MQVCVVAYKRGQLKMLAHTFDRSLGGRVSDEVLFRFLVKILAHTFDRSLGGRVSDEVLFKFLVEKFKEQY